MHETLPTAFAYAEKDIEGQAHIGNIGDSTRVKCAFGFASLQTARNWRKFAKLFLAQTRPQVMPFLHTVHHRISIIYEIIVEVPYNF